MLLKQLIIYALAILACLKLSNAIKSEEVEDDFSRVKHVIKPRHVRIFSKPPGEEWGKQTGRNLGEHLDNALQGGTVGVEFNLKKLRDKFSGYMEKARKYLPFFFKKKPINDSRDKPENHPKDLEDDNDIGSKPKLDRSNEYEDEVSMEFELDPRRINANPEDIVFLEREKLVNNEI